MCTKDPEKYINGIRDIVRKSVFKKNNRIIIVEPKSKNLHLNLKRGVILNCINTDNYLVRFPKMYVGFSPNTDIEINASEMMLISDYDEYRRKMKSVINNGHTVKHVEETLNAYDYITSKKSAAFIHNMYKILTLLMYNYDVNSLNIHLSHFELGNYKLDGMVQYYNQDKHPVFVIINHAITYYNKLKSLDNKYLENAELVSNLISEYQEQVELLNWPSFQGVETVINDLGKLIDTLIPNKDVSTTSTVNNPLKKKILPNLVVDSEIFLTPKAKKVNITL